MILIADSGSTKTDWCIVFNDTPIKRIGTKGINPFFQSEEEIQQELTHSLLPQLPEGTINSVFFYGAGCSMSCFNSSKEISSSLTKEETAFR